MRRIFLVVLFAQLCPGCATPYRLTIDDYSAAAGSIRLGISRAEVIRVLEPTQRRLRGIDRKPTEMYTKGGVATEILYFRSGARGRTAEERFTPYVFHDDKLVAVGWTTLARPGSTAGPVRPAASRSTTVIPPF